MKTLPRQDAPQIAYRVEGSGPPLVLVHGVGGDSTSWDGIVPALAPRFRVIRPDLRGHGGSAPIRGDVKLDDFVRDVTDVMDAEGVPACRVAGFSLGGLIAQAVALAHPAVSRSSRSSARPVPGPKKSARAGKRVPRRSRASSSPMSQPGCASAGSPTNSSACIRKRSKRACSSSSSPTPPPTCAPSPFISPPTSATGCMPSAHPRSSSPASTTRARPLAWRWPCTAGCAMRRSRSCLPAPQPARRGAGAGERGAAGLPLG